MEEKLIIRKEKSERFVIFEIEGRIDGYWSRHLDDSLEESLRAGEYQIRLAMDKVDYLSSMGIRILIKYTKQLKQLNGSFGLIRISENVSHVLEMAGLSSFLVAEPEEISPSAEKPGSQLSKQGFTYTLHPQSVTQLVQCRVFGNPSQLHDKGFSAEDCQNLPFSEHMYGIGLGAIGRDFEDCKNRFGEFMGMGNVVAYLPSGSSKSPDYMVRTGKLIPEIKGLYGIVFQGDFSYQLDFYPDIPNASIPFSKLLKNALEITGLEQMAMIMLAESSGLVGTSLNLSPVAGHSHGNFFGFPQLKETLNYTTESEFNHSMTLTLGIASKNPNPQLQPFLRHAVSGSNIYQHFHTAAFSYFPLKKTGIQLEETLVSLFDSENIQSILHLIHDERTPVGTGESEFHHGISWIGPLDQHLISH